jgi:hypothetical protein
MDGWYPTDFRQLAPTTSVHIAALFNRKRGWRNIAIAPAVEAEVEGSDQRGDDGIDAKIRSRSPR